MKRVTVAALVARGENRVLKPGAFDDLYVNPAADFARLVDQKVLMRLAHGYYLVIPEEQRDGYWQPDIEAVALGVAVADYGRDTVTLMGPAAARHHGAIPRALAAATVAVPRQRAALETTAGRVQFVTRKVEHLDTQRATTAITTGWVTTPEQTVLDLADRPDLGGIAPTTAEEAIRTLTRRVDPQLVARLAQVQRKHAAWQRYCWLAGYPALPLRDDIPTLGLRGDADPATYGLIETVA